MGRQKWGGITSSVWGQAVERWQPQTSSPGSLLSAYPERLSFVRLLLCATWVLDHLTVILRPWDHYPHAFCSSPSPPAFPSRPSGAGGVGEGPDPFFLSHIAVNTTYQAIRVYYF